MTKIQKKIGIFLGVDPHEGGAYQYALNILDAGEHLSSQGYEIVVIYTNSSWKKIIERKPFKSSYVNKGILSRAFGKVWRDASLPLSGWRKITPAFHPIAKSLIKENCDIWIFPSQDGWTYQIPVPSLGVIHDLMHRYEKRFPELAEPSEYKRREYLYSNLCQWSKGILVDSNVSKFQVQESYHLNPDRIHVLPFAPPGYIYKKNPSNGFQESFFLH